MELPNPPALLSYGAGLHCTALHLDSGGKSCDAVHDMAPGLPLAYVPPLLHPQVCFVRQYDQVCAVLPGGGAERLLEVLAASLEVRATTPAPSHARTLPKPAPTFAATFVAMIRVITPSHVRTTASAG